MDLRSCLLSIVIAAACFACGARTSLDSDTLGDAGETSITLTIPLGAYSGCSSTLVTLGPNFEGTSGGDGKITLAQDGDSVVATLAFTPFASGTVAFTPTSEASATFAAGQSFDVDTVGFSNNMVTVIATTGSLVVASGTLFISIHGGVSVGTDEVSGYFHCPVPTTLEPTSIVTNASPGTPVTPGVYGSCTSTLSSIEPVTVYGGGSGMVSITGSAGTLNATWSTSLTQACGALDFTISGNTATLVAGQTCTIHEPCGPPPSLGPPSTVPPVATLTNMVGLMTVDEKSLFIDVVGDTPPLTCGTHYVSIICASM